jgi:hypothetical protein
MYMQAGDSVSYYDETTGRTRIDPEVARKSGRVAGFNMAGGKASFSGLVEHFAELPDAKLTCLGRCDSRLRTVGVWERPEGVGENSSQDQPPTDASNSEKYRRGIVYYLTEKGHVCGVLFCNVLKRLVEFFFVCLLGGSCCCLLFLFAAVSRTLELSNSLSRGLCLASFFSPLSPWYLS